MSTNSEILDLVRRIRATVDPNDPQKRKFKVAKSGKHQKVLRGNGSVLADADGPIIISGSPGDMRWREMHVHRLMRAGVFKSDPYKPNDGEAEEQPKRGGHLKDPAVEERRLQALADRSAGFMARTMKVRERFEPVVAKLGGWSRGGSGIRVSDFVLVLRHWIKTQQPKLMPETKGHAVSDSAWYAAVQNLRTPGGTIGSKWLPLFEAFVEGLEIKDDDGLVDAPETALAFMDLLRAARGIGAEPEADEDEDKPYDPGFYVRPKETVMTLEAELTLSPRAMKAFWWMARGATPDERDEVIAMVTEIVAMEVQTNRQERQ